MIQDRDVGLFKEGLLHKIRNPKIKCPICKKKTQFNQFDLGLEGSGYLMGSYARLYVCSKCSIIICKTEEDLE